MTHDLAAELRGYQAELRHNPDRATGAEAEINRVRAQIGARGARLLAAATHADMAGQTLVAAQHRAAAYQIAGAVPPEPSGLRDTVEATPRTTAVRRRKEH